MKEILSNRGNKQNNATRTLKVENAANESSQMVHNKFPNYEEYMEISKKQLYFPVDPMEKLASTIQKYCQVFFQFKKTFLEIIYLVDFRRSTVLHG